MKIKKDCRNNVLEKYLKLIILLSNKKCTTFELMQELNVCKRTISRYKTLLSCYFQVVEEIRGENNEQRHYFYIEKGRGRIQKIIEID